MPPRPKVRLPYRRVLSHSALSAWCRPWSQQLPLHVHGRAFADKTPIADRPFEHPPEREGEPKGPNMDQLPHVSEEAAAISKSMGEQGPDIAHQGTPVSEVVKGDKEAIENLPKVMKEQLKNEQNSTGGGKRSFSTFAKAQPSRATRMASRSSQARPFSTSSGLRQELEQQQQQDVNLQALQLAMEASPQTPAAAAAPQAAAGLKFDAPTMPLPPGSHMKERYDSVVEQVTKLLMRHGKLSVAQRNMNIILTHLRTSPAPKQSERAPLVANAPPHSALPLQPTTYLTVAIDSVAPLFRLRSQSGLAGGGLSIQIPVPLRLKQRRRAAVMWILEQVGKRKGSTSPFPKRFAEEIVAVVEGRSAVWERRNALHTTGIRARANLSVVARKR